MLTAVERVLILKGAELLREVGPRHLLELAAEARGGGEGTENPEAVPAAASESNWEAGRAETADGAVTPPGEALAAAALGRPSPAVASEQSPPARTTPPAEAERIDDAGGPPAP